MAGRDEQETQVTQGRLDDYVEVWSNNVVDVRKLEKESRARRVSPEGEVTAEELAEHLEAGFGVTYRISTEDFTPLGGFRRKRKPLTDEQKAALGERLRGARS
ncbi:hypothetical protein SEA_HORTUS1_23 [Microbacterium phage Hortus1]|nr:hypothetical protein SEA_HORTUS1_23 [Microbacterium phage Hortus1]AWY05594.1 hypothetical protein SEA_OLINDD_23 [Microbacterium phage OlinDD]AWY05847.1 hypothetical protein SEA_PIONEER3_23 [Microbacterium phage Pioneer3]AWY06353.1 hypothetical protein SEA_TANDEM_23 [Microbacterium phage Tandem]QAU07356.1 hypothetical protein SEA_ALLEB_24 [Microbacterium phage Alleb]